MNINMALNPFKPQLEHFLTLCEFKNISKAARELGLSQPQLTKSLQGLESETRTLLFQRTNRGLVLTDQGQHLQQTLSDLHLQWTYLSHQTPTVQGRFRIGAHPLIANKRLPELMAHLVTLFPQVDFQYSEISSKEASHLIHNNELDLALAVNPKALNELYLGHIATEEICIWGPAGDSDCLVINPQLIQFTRLKKMAKYKKIIEVESYELCLSLAYNLRCHALVPEPALDGREGLFKKKRVLEKAKLCWIINQGKKNHPVIGVVRNFWSSVKGHETNKLNK